MAYGVYYPQVNQWPMLFTRHKLTGSASLLNLKIKENFTLQKIWFFSTVNHSLLVNKV